MTAGRKILVVFPHNFLERTSGVNQRYFTLVSWMKNHGFTIDLLGLRNFGSDWTTFDRQNESGLIRNLFLYDFRLGYHRQRLTGWIGDLAGKLTGKSRVPHHRLPDYAFPGMARMFRQILQREHYDYIVIGYVYWANLVKQDLPGKTLRVLTIEDLISRKIRERTAESRWTDGTIREETARVDLFDRVICLSHEELDFFAKHALSPDYFYIPVFMDRPVLQEVPKRWDLMFIGFDNPDNIEGINWFMREVRPLLPAEVTLAVAGRVTTYVPDLPGVTRLGEIADPGEVYAQCRFAINPLHKGTGMKVKLVESLSYGVPVISTTRGLCGLPPGLAGRFAVTDDPREFATIVMNFLGDTEGYAERCREARAIFDAYFETGITGRELAKVFDTTE
ncbi:MAG TPA: glycosyltransferase [Bacteroidales bacterium]|nr:glycosyltransferase [Bacteroidales bacterium]HPS61625.1 glycosyltransferase [Bacteroidales bacterium]